MQYKSRTSASHISASQTNIARVLHNNKIPIIQTSQDTTTTTTTTITTTTTTTTTTTKVKYMWICIARLRANASNALRYGSHSVTCKQHYICLLLLTTTTTTTTTTNTHITFALDSAIIWNSSRANIQ